MNEVSDNKPGTSQGMDVLFFLTGKETLNWILFYYPRWKKHFCSHYLYPAYYKNYLRKY